MRQHILQPLVCAATALGALAILHSTCSLAKTETRHEYKAGTSMHDLTSAGRREFKEPLKNAEFLRAVTALPAPDRQAFLVSLSGLYEGCDCAGPIDFSLYGLRNTDDVYAMSGCGIYLEGHYVRCHGTDALAVWDKRIRRFYFAIVHAQKDERTNGERRPPAVIHTFPAVETWSDAAKSQLTDWQSNAKWKS